jgi:hypothetical protein
MKTTVLFAAALVCCLASCDLALSQREARRTVVGISTVQVVRASQRVLAAEGFDLAQVFPRDGNLRTAWRETPRERLSYTVSTTPFVDEDGREIPGALTVAVACTAQDRVVGGWSEEYASGRRTRAILQDIASLLLEAQPPVQRTARPAPAPREVTRPPVEPAPVADPAPEPAAGAMAEGDTSADGGPPAEEVAP